MKTEQAIKLLHRLQDEQFDGKYGDERREALEMAVRALEQNLGNNGSICAKTVVNDEDRTTGDTIYRQAALDAVNDCGICIQKIVDLPSAQPHWTPCNEKKPETMPKTNEDVLMQFSSNMGVGFYQDGWAVNTGEGIYSAVDISEEKPIAWMPLPEPYGGDAK